MNTWKPDSLQRPRLRLALVVGACLGLGACGTLRIHRPQDFANAQQAQTRFQAADLAQAVAAERQRLDQVLAEELDLVRRHTLARRDARLVYMIGEGDREAAWKFLKDDLWKRLEELGIRETAELKDQLRRDAAAKAAKENLETRAGQYRPFLAGDPSLPEPSCPPLPDVQPPAPNTAPRLVWDSYADGCQKYLAIVKPIPNATAVLAMEAAKAAAQNATQEARDKLAKAREQYAKELAASDSPPDWERVRAAALDLVGRAEEVKTALDAFIDGDDRTLLDDLGLKGFADKITGARTELAGLGLDLSGVVRDLGSLPAVAKLEANRAAVVAGLSSTLKGEVATDILKTLQEVKLVAQGPTEAPLTAMVLKEKQLALDITAARNREAFYDQTLALLEQQKTAHRDELAYLGQAELRRQELESEGCLSADTAEAPELLKGLFTEQDPAVMKCRETVFRLLVQYSAAWTFGRVESEQIDYRLIALHHESALDTSDVAFQKWASLLGPPIDQLVAYTKTGLRPEDILTPIVDAFGLGAIAVGVN